MHVALLEEVLARHEDLVDLLVLLGSRLTVLRLVGLGGLLVGLAVGARVRTPRNIAICLRPSVIRAVAALTVLLQVLLNACIMILVIVVRAHLIPILLIAGSVLRSLLQVLYRILVLNLRAILVGDSGKFILIWGGLLDVRGFQAIGRGGLRLFLLEDIVYLAVWPTWIGLDTLLKDPVVALDVLLVVIDILHSNNKYLMEL